MKKIIFIALSGLLLLLTFLVSSWKLKESDSLSPEKRSRSEVVLTTSASLSDRAMELYRELNLQASGLDFGVFERSYTGYLNLKQTDSSALKKPVITVVDFSRPSTQNRFWVIDLEAKKLVYFTLVAHGQGSGELSATTFSNKPNSYQSSLGFYRTGEVYIGKHGRSLKLDGLDKGFNDRARERAIVVHGAEYVSNEFIQKTGRLGRSQGCPAIPLTLSDKVIDEIEGNTLLFINGSDSNYSSPLLDPSNIS